METPIVIRPTDRLFVLTGAGVSAESGIPTFRGQDGLWEGHRLEDVATPEAFTRDPELVWRFYSMRRSVAASCKPNPGHLALARLEAKLGDRFLLCTQNVDALHEAAGTKRVLHMHGSLFESRCSDESCRTATFHDEKLYMQNSEIPVCSCGELIRPNIVWFGEIPLFMEKIVPALDDCTIFITIGSSGVVHPAASFAQMAKQNGAQSIYVGLESPSNSHAFNRVILGPSGERLPRLFDLRSF
jgi:NAD-dependent deacetylase